MATSTTTEPSVVQLQPYIFFYGRCEEALDLYKTVLGGTCEIMRVKDAPIAAQMPAELQDKIMHASFTAPGVAFMASDGQQLKTIDPEAGNISISLSLTDRAEGERILKGLSEGGKVMMPLEDAFWGGKFANFVDRFGIEWMIVTP